MKAIVVSQVGGPEVLEYRDIPVPQPGEGRVQVKVAAAGVNFIDVYNRTGLYPGPVPFTPGFEGAGTVEGTGERVCFYTTERCAYAEFALVPEKHIIPLPGDVPFETASAAMLQGMTAHYLTHSTYPLKTGDWALIHAAAGGTGGLIVQMAKLRGARVIGTASTSKLDVAREAGCDEVIDYTKVENFAAEVKRITGGRGVDVAYDSVGKSTFAGSIDSLCPRGMMVSFGNASGPVDPISPLLLTQKGSLFLTRPSLGAYIATREELTWRASDTLNWIREGKLKLRIDKVYPLAEAAQAHRDLEGRKTTGKLLLKP